MPYDDIVQRLRDAAKMSEALAVLLPHSEGNATAKLYSEAADAIEELSRRETPMKITEIHVDEYYCPACGAENNCDQGHVQDAYCPDCGQRLLPQPPKEE